MTPMALTYKVLFPSRSTFETPPPLLGFHRPKTSPTYKRKRLQAWRQRFVQPHVVQHSTRSVNHCTNSFGPPPKVRRPYEHQASQIDNNASTHIVRHTVHLPAAFP